MWWWSLSHLFWALMKILSFLYSTGQTIDRFLTPYSYYFPSKGCIWSSMCPSSLLGLEVGRSNSLYPVTFRTWTLVAFVSLPRTPPGPAAKSKLSETALQGANPAAKAGYDLLINLLCCVFRYFRCSLIHFFFHQTKKLKILHKH